MKYKKGFYCLLVINYLTHWENIYYFDGKTLQWCSNDGEWLKANFKNLKELECFSPQNYPDTKHELIYLGE